jgi:hypothetical protein
LPTFGQLDGEALERGRIEHEGLRILRGFDQIGAEVDRHARDLRQMIATLLRIPLRSVEPRPDRGPAHADLGQHRTDGFEGADFIVERASKRVELLAERHRHGILELRAPHLDDVGELFALGAECSDQFLVCSDDLGVAERHADMHRAGIGIIGGLRAVHVIVRITVFVFAFLVSHQLERAVGDHLVRVHVRRRARPALEDVEAELVVELSVYDLLAGLLDAGQDLLREPLGVEVGARGSELHHGEAFDEVRVLAQLDAGDLEVFECASRLNAVIRVGGHGEVTEEVVFDPCVRRGH